MGDYVHVHMHTSDGKPYIGLEPPGRTRMHRWKWLKRAERIRAQRKKNYDRRMAEAD